MTELLDAMEKNNTFKGSLIISSKRFTDNLGLKIAKIISNNSLASLKIVNPNKPFSDRVACAIGDALEKNTSLIKFGCFLEIGENSPVHIIKFLTNPNSRLRVLKHLRITKKLFETLSQYLNKGSKLTKIKFYYEPLKEVNLLYKKEIEQDVLDNLANKIETNYASKIIERRVLTYPCNWFYNITLRQGFIPCFFIVIKRAKVLSSALFLLFSFLRFYF